MDIVMTNHNELGYRVLIAEDHPIEQKLLRAVLAPAGYVMELAGNGKQALSYLETADFDLIIMDSHMPILSGAETIKAIRSRPDWKRHIPILLMTEDVGNVRQDQALAITNASLAKPLDIARFISIATELAKTGRELRQ
jgi:CheY-like chemotaxis protein